MSIFYSPATGGFYSPEIHGDAIPQDAVGVTVDDHAALLAGQAAGSCIIADETGAPVLADPPPPSEADLLAWMRIERDRLLRESDFTQISDSPISSEDREAWRAYRQALRDLPETISDPITIIWPTAPSI